jgi:hypothetical protein
MSKCHQFVVTVTVPAGVTLREMADYIREAVQDWHNSLDPETPLFNLDDRTVTVKCVKQPVKQRNVK